MKITDEEALALLASFGKRISDAREQMARDEQYRNSLIRTLDGQPGMGRTQMAEAAGITRGRLHQILYPEGRGGVAEALFDLPDAAVLLPEDLFDMLTAALEDAEDAVRERPEVSVDIERG